MLRPTEPLLVLCKGAVIILTALAWLGGLLLALLKLIVLRQRQKAAIAHTGPPNTQPPPAPFPVKQPGHSRLLLSLLRHAFDLQNRSMYRPPTENSRRAPAVHQCACSKSCSRRCVTRADLCRDSHRRKLRLPRLTCSSWWSVRYSHVGLACTKTLVSMRPKICAATFSSRVVFKPQVTLEPTARRISTSLL